MGSQNVEQGNVEFEIDFAAMIRLLFRNLKWILAAALVVAVLAGVYALIDDTTADEPTYHATASVYTMPTIVSTEEGSFLSWETYCLADFLELATSRVVLESAIETASLDTTYEDLLAVLTAGYKTDTSIMDVTVLAKDATFAVEASNAIANALSDYIALLLNAQSPEVIEFATEERVILTAAEFEEAATAEVRLYVILGASVGFCLMAGFFVLCYAIDPNYRTLGDTKKCIARVAAALKDPE